MKKKGFTLVELLAVIAILAILMLLIMPNVLSMFNQGKRDTFKAQVSGIVKFTQQQIQSDILNGKSVYTYCNTSDECSDKLNTTEGDVKYKVLMDSSNNVAMIGVQSENYCYVGKDVNNINSDDFKENHVLYCGSTACTCVEGSIRHVYWNRKSGESSQSWTASTTPTNLYNSVDDLGFINTGSYIKTTMDKNNKPVMHEACLYHGGSSFCLTSGYGVDGDSDGSLTLSKFKNDILDMYGVVPVCNASTSSYGSYVACDFLSGRHIHAYYKNITDVHVTYDGIDCLVYGKTSNAAKCQ